MISSTTQVNIFGGLQYKNSSGIIFPVNSLKWSSSGHKLPVLEVYALKCTTSGHTSLGHESAHSDKSLGHESAQSDTNYHSQMENLDEKVKHPHLRNNRTHHHSLDITMELEMPFSDVCPVLAMIRRQKVT